MKKLFLLLICILMTAQILNGCGSTNNTDAAKEQSGITFTDDLGRQVTVTSYDRVGIASGSFAECWLLAGGTPVAVTQDALQERDLSLPDDIIDLGSLVHPSMEVILSADLDLLLLVSTVETHLALGDTLEKAGIPHAYLNIETFEDYLHVLKIFTDITGRKDLYKQNGSDIQSEIDTIIQTSKLTDAPRVLILRASASKITARNSKTMVGQMLSNFGCINIADHDSTLLEELSLEVIVRENPEYIFVICRGDEAEAKASMEAMLSSNAIWNTIDAIQKDNLFYLDKDLFHYKPTVRWGESYEVLANIFAEN